MATPTPDWPIDPAQTRSAEAASVAITPHVDHLPDHGFEHVARFRVKKLNKAGDAAKTIPIYQDPLSGKADGVETLDQVQALEKLDVSEGS